MGIAASLSGDPAMMSDYRTGDPYLAFGKNAEILPPDATEESHGAQRDALKACVLGLQYGMGEETLAERIGKPRIVARELIRAHQQRYRKFWDMADNAIAIIMDHRPIQTVGGWPLQVCSDPNPNSVMNFPMQANGAEMLRLACSMATERGIEVHAPVHDAVLIGSSIENIERDTKTMQEIMEEASRAVLGGFNIPTEAKIVRYPDRYMDKRGVVMWDRVMRRTQLIERVHIYRHAGIFYYCRRPHIPSALEGAWQIDIRQHLWQQAFEIVNVTGVVIQDVGLLLRGPRTAAQN